MLNCTVIVFENIRRRYIVNTYYTNYVLVESRKQTTKQQKLIYL